VRYKVGTRIKLNGKSSKILGCTPMWERDALATIVNGGCPRRTWTFDHINDNFLKGYYIIKLDEPYQGPQLYWWAANDMFEEV
jgi:hypothetical protein